MAQCNEAPPKKEIGTVLGGSYRGPSDNDVVSPVSGSVSNVVNLNYRTELVLELF